MDPANVHGLLAVGPLANPPRAPIVQPAGSVRHLLILSTTALCALLCACTAASPTFPAAAPRTGKRTPPIERNFRAADVAKADVDIVAEAHVRECLASARLLMEKLYRRNPREWRKGNYASMEAAVA